MLHASIEDTSGVARVDEGASHEDDNRRHELAAIAAAVAEQRCFKQVSDLAFESLGVTDKGREAAEQLSSTASEIERMISHFSLHANRHNSVDHKSFRVLLIDVKDRLLSSNDPVSCGCVTQAGLRLIRINSKSELDCSLPCNDIRYLPGNVDLNSCCSNLAACSLSSFCPADASSRRRNRKPVSI